MLGFGSLPRDLAMKNIQLFAEEVAPYLRDLWTDTEHHHHWWPERLGGDPTRHPRCLRHRGHPDPRTPTHQTADGGRDDHDRQHQRPAITEEVVPVWNGRLTIRVKVAGAGAPLLYLHPAAGLAWDPFLSHLAQTLHRLRPRVPRHQRG